MKKLIIALLLTSCNGSLELETKAEQCFKNGNIWTCRDERIDNIYPMGCVESQEYEDAYDCPDTYDNDFICTSDRDYIRLQNEIVELLSKVKQCNKR